MPRLIDILPHDKDPIEYLVNVKFPKAPSVSKSDLIRGLTPESEAEKAKRAAEVIAYRKHLNTLSSSKIEYLVTDAKREAKKSLLEKEKEEEKARFFNKPDARADYHHWARMSYWDCDDCTALSLERDPRLVNWQNTEPLIGISEFASRYVARRELILRAKIMEQLWDRTIPRVFLAWAMRMQITVPDELVEAVEALGDQIADWKTLYDQQKKIADQTNRELEEEKIAHKEKNALLAKLQIQLNNKHNKSATSLERQTLLKLVIGMAQGGYGYAPDASRTPVPSEIAGDLHRLKLSVHEDTIRKYLNEAKELLL